MVELSRYQTVFTGVAGAPWYSNIYFEGGTPEGAAYGPNLATFWEAIDNVMHNSITWTIDSSYTVIESTTGEIQDVGTWDGATGVADLSAEALPWANQAVINWKTGFYTGGRELRGKTYVPALTQTANDGGILLAATRTTIEDAANALVTNSASALAVWGRTHGVEAIVETATVPTKIAVLRSRRD